MNKIFLKVNPILLFSILLFITSCDSNDDSTFEPEQKVVQPGVDKLVSTPCDLSIFEDATSRTIIVPCEIDLEGTIININEGVTLINKGGKLINGTLNLANNVIIDSELLNNSLTLSGTIPKLKDNLFKFNPENWGIVEGPVSDKIAFENRNKLQKTIDFSKTLFADTFEMDRIDAFFHLEYEWSDARGYNDRAIHLPSNFHLKMTDNTYLRLQPNFWPRGYFISVLEKSNVKISGGNLIGDRFQHDYSPINDELGLPRNTHEWPGIIVISGSQNIVVENTNMMNSTGDAFIIGAAGHRTNSETKFNKNIIARNCTMHQSRRNNISITDGEDIRIENCTITDAGLGENIFDSNNEKVISSAGVAPRIGIDIEPFRGIDDNNDFINFEKVERVTVTGCTFTGNNVSSFINYSGSDVIFENNFSDHSVGASFDIGGTKFLNNTLIANQKNRVSNGINFGTFILNQNGIDVQHSSGSIAEGNTIKGFVRGIRVMGKDPIVSNNVIEDFNVGIQIDSDNTLCTGNTMTTDRFIAAYGLFAENINNGIFTNNTIVVPRRPLFFKNLNLTAGAFIALQENTFESKEGYDLLIENVNNITISNNTFENTTIENR